MKKLILICIIALALFTACQASPFDASNDNLSGEPAPSIGVRSLAELETMREMAVSKDKTAVEQYLRSVEGGGADSQKDLKQFLSIVDSTPYVALIEGEITWISHSAGHTIDTEKAYQVLYVSTEAKNGDWVRIEYDLLTTDVAGKIDAAVKTATDSLLSRPLQSGDKKVTLYTETREAHPSGTGDIITWIADIDGIYARIVYYVSDADSVVTADICKQIEIANISND